MMQTSFARASGAHPLWKNAWHKYNVLVNFKTTKIATKSPVSKKKIMRQMTYDIVVQERKHFWWPWLFAMGTKKENTMTFWNCQKLQIIVVGTHFRIARNSVWPLPPSHTPGLSFSPLHCLLCCNHHYHVLPLATILTNGAFLQMPRAQ